MIYQLPSPQTFLVTVSALVGALMTAWIWRHSRIVHDEWQAMSTVPYADAQQWSEALATVRFSFGVLHQLCSVIVITSLASALFAASECARQMPAVQWEKPKD